MSLPHQVPQHEQMLPCAPHREPLPSGSYGASFKLIVAGAALAFAAATLLWVRFGPSVFVDALGAVWTCL